MVLNSSKFENHFMNKSIFSTREICRNLIHFNDLYKLNIKTIYDLGANIGIHSIHYAYYLPNSKVYSFEPVKDNYKILCKNIHNYEYNNKIIPFNYGISINNKDEELYLSLPNTRESKNTGLYSLKVNDEFQKKSVLCKFKPLSSFKIPIPDFVKLDIEGCEDEIINHNLDIFKNVKLIIIEINNSINNSDENIVYKKSNTNLLNTIKKKLNFVQLNIKNQKADYFFINKKFI